jgi:hypothetical protein
MEQVAAMEVETAEQGPPRSEQGVGLADMFLESERSVPRKR